MPNKGPRKIVAVFISEIAEAKELKMVSQHKTKVFRLGELYCGPGGIGVAAALACVRSKGITYRLAHQWATDYDIDSCETYYNRFFKMTPAQLIADERLARKKKINSFVLHKDVREINFSLMPKVDALTFGFPCNDFSLVGKQKGLDGKFGPLYSYGLDAVRRLKPDWFMAENVGGLRSANGGNALDKIIAEMNQLKPAYAIQPWYYRFEDYGVPQTRHRVIIVGIKKSLKARPFLPPAPTTADKRICAAEALAGIPANASHQEKTRQSASVVQRLIKINPGQNAWNSDLPKSLQLNVKGARLSQIYRRLHPDQPAYTITGSGGGGTHVYHWSEPRALTNRERARIQTFPDDYEFFGSKESVRKQIGMAVPPAGARVIIEAVLKTLAGVEYTPATGAGQLKLFN